MRILVCDDIEERGQQAVREVQRGDLPHQVELLPLDELRETIEALVDQGRPFLNGDRDAALPSGGRSFGGREVDLLILDNNLAELRIPGARHTAEALAGHVRAFTDVPYIVSLNKNPLTDFDLRFLVGDYQTVTDLPLNRRHLSSVGLWTGTPGSPDEFLPWYWPILDDAPARRRRQVEFIEQRLDEPVLVALGFGEGRVAHLSRHARGAILRDSDSEADLESGTFRDFFIASCRSLPIEKERGKLAGLLEAPDADTRRAARGIVARVAAAEIERWFRRDVLGPQDLLVDVPHLLMRMPFLLGDRAGEIDAWNACLSVPDRPFGLSADSYTRFLERAKYGHGVWSEVPCFWWPMLDGDKELNTMFYGDQTSWAPAVFCEDLSRFRAFDEDDPGRPREFEAEFEGAWSQRHVALLAGRSYTPKSRFAL